MNPRETSQSGSGEPLGEDQDAPPALVLATLDAFASPAWVSDDEGRILAVNDAAARRLGVAKSQLVGARLSSLSFLHETAPGTATSDVARGGDAREQPSGLPRRGRSVWRTRPLPTERAALFVTSMEDASSVVDLPSPAPTDRFRAALEAAPTGMILVDGDGKIVMVNAPLATTFGYAQDELVGAPLEVLVPSESRQAHVAHRRGFTAQSTGRVMGPGRDLCGVRKDGSEVPVDIRLNPLRTEDGDFVLGSVVDISERKRHTAALEAALREREVLVQEVHHRVKNNLQMVSSLIRMQLRRLPEGQAGDGLIECQTRVQAIALIHEQLYRSRDLARVPFGEYVRSLAHAVVAAAALRDERVSLRLEAEDVALAVSKAIPCGLVLNELLTNALKHAFPDGRRGVLYVALTRVEGQRVRLRVADDGVGLPTQGLSEPSTSLGMQLVRRLTLQLEGELEVGHADEGGAAFQLTFPTGAHHAAE